MKIAAPRYPLALQILPKPKEAAFRPEPKRAPAAWPIPRGANRERPQSLRAPPSQADARFQSLETATATPERRRPSHSDPAARKVPAGRACLWRRRQYFAVGKLDGSQRHISRAVFGAKAFDRDLGSAPHSVWRPSAEPRQHSETP